MDLFFLPAFLWRKMLLRRSVVLESPLLMLLGIQYSITLSEISQRPSQLNLEKTCTESTRRPKTFGLELYHCTGMLSGLVQNLLEKIFDLPTLVNEFILKTELRTSSFILKWFLKQIHTIATINSQNFLISATHFFFQDQNKLRTFGATVKRLFLSFELLISEQETCSLWI